MAEASGPDWEKIVAAAGTTADWRQTLDVDAPRHRKAAMMAGEAFLGCWVQLKMHNLQAGRLRVEPYVLDEDRCLQAAMAVMIEAYGAALEDLLLKDEGEAPNGG